MQKTESTSIEQRQWKKYDWKCQVMTLEGQKSIPVFYTLVFTLYEFISIFTIKWQLYGCSKQIDLL